IDSVPMIGYASRTMLAMHRGQRYHMREREKERERERERTWSVVERREDGDYSENGR
ncbi:unnamed protein product, partial [marine sediment metagenome]